MMATTLIFIGAAAAAPPIPAFEKDFYVGLYETININQGGYDVQYGSCCSLEHSAQCKLQSINMGEDVREQGSKQRTRSDSAQGSIVNDYIAKKEMAVVPGSAVNSSHAWACAQYCPTTGGFLPALMVGDNQTGPFDTPRFMGKAKITLPPAACTGRTNCTKIVDHWRWSETILKVLKMTSNDYYIDTSVTPAQPWYKSTVIMPFGQKIGSENVSFIDYAPQDVSSYFDIDPDSMANCPMSDQCQQPDASLRRVHPAGASSGLLGLSLLDVARRQLAEHRHAAVVEERADPPPPPNVTFAKDFSASEDSRLMINQGSSMAANGDPCCLGGSLEQAPQCQVQLQHIKGQRFFDLSHQRERFEDTVSGQTTVDDYTAHKSMLINVTDGKETCQEFCPIDPGDEMHPLDPFDPFDEVHDLGQTTYEGQTVEHYRWTDVILKVIKMQTTDFYADLSKRDQAVPVFLSSAITPFGQAQIGSENHTWSEFTAGVPPASKFAIAGVDECPRSNQCGSPAKQAHRIRTRQLHTFSRYQKAA